MVTCKVREYGRRPSVCVLWGKKENVCRILWFIGVRHVFKGCRVRIGLRYILRAYCPRTGLCFLTELEDDQP